MVVPERHDEYHSLRKGFGHVGSSALLLVSVPVTEYLFLLVAELCGDRVALHARDGRCWLLNCLASLNVETLDFHIIASADELCDDSELLGSIDSHAFAIKVLDAHAVSIEVTAVRVAYASVAVSGVCAAAAVTVAASLFNGAASVGCNCCTDGVRFPDVHLSAAGAVTTNASICIVVRRLPTFNVALEGLSVIQSFALVKCDLGLTSPLINLRSLGH